MSSDLSNTNAIPRLVPNGEDSWENEGGHVRCNPGSVRYSAGAGLPYEAVLTRPRGQPLYRSFATMREAEAFIRQNGPVPIAALSTLYDRPSDNPAPRITS